MNGELCDSSFRNGQLWGGSTPHPIQIHSSAAPHLIRSSCRPVELLTCKEWGRGGRGGEKTLQLYDKTDFQSAESDAVFFFFLRVHQSDELPPWGDSSVFTSASTSPLMSCIWLLGWHPVCILLGTSGDNCETLLCVARLVWKAQVVPWKDGRCRYDNAFTPRPPFTAKRAQSTYATQSGRLNSVREECNHYSWKSYYLV